jgi:ArsR family transcriptional regulator
MNETIHEAQAELCRVFTHPTRIQVLELLASGEKSVGELVDGSGVAQPTLSQHLAVLRGRGVVSTRRQGTTVYYALADERIIEACHLMRAVLLERYRKLGLKVDRAAKAGR